MNYRHGDLALIQVESLPEGLERSETNVLLQEGSGGNPHTFKGGNFYPKINGSVLGYLEAKNTKLYHVEHGEKQVGGLKEAPIEDGIYQIVRQNEETHEGLKPVID